MSIINYNNIWKRVLCLRTYINFTGGVKLKKNIWKVIRVSILSIILLVVGFFVYLYINQPISIYNVKEFESIGDPELDKELSKEEVEYQVNDFVYHDVFGEGKVLSVSGSIVKVAFKMPYGIKTLMKNHKSLRKV